MVFSYRGINVAPVIRQFGWGKPSCLNHVPEFTDQTEGTIHREYADAIIPQAASSKSR